MPRKERPENLGGLARSAVTGRRRVMVLLGGALAFAGCAGEPRQAREIEPTQARADEARVDLSGSRAELVFSGLAVQSDGNFVSSEETSLAWRNDARLGARDGGTETSRLVYPEPDAPSLDRLRVIYLQPRPDRVEYFGRHRQRSW